MTPKSLKYSFIFSLVAFCAFSAKSQCTSETINSTLTISMDECASNTIEGTNVDYSEFTATTSNANICNNVYLAGGNLYRNNPTVNPHSCTPGVNGTPGMCIGYNQECLYTPGSDQAVRFDVVVDPTNGPSSLNTLEFYELAPSTFQYLGGISGQNNYPLFYAVRVLANGVEVFHETDIETSQAWSLESFDFSSNPAFTVSTPTTFGFELTAYCRVNNGADIAVWDLDEIAVSTSCDSSSEDVSANFDISGGQTATSCNGTSFTFLSPANPTGAVCTWYFDWPSTDPSTTIVGVSPSYTFPVEGIYTVRKEVSFGDCFDAFELQVSAFNSGIIGTGIGGSLDGIDVNVVACSGNAVELNLVSTAFDTNVGYEVDTWNWTITINGVAQAATGPSVSLNVSNTDLINVSLMVSSTSGCEATFNENFNVNDLFPTASYIATLESCVDNGYIISFVDNTNTTGFTVESYSWSLVVDGQTVNPGNVPSFTVETIGDLITVTHTVFFTNGCSSQTTTETISVLDDLVPDFDIAIVGAGGGGGGDCESIDQILQFNATGGSINGSITSVTWVVTVGGQSFNFTGTQIDLNGIITSDAVVTATVTYSNGCVFDYSENFTPADFGDNGGMISVSFNGNPVIDCAGDVTPLLLNPNPNYTYNWDPTTGLTFTDMVNFSDPVVSVTTATVYNVTVTEGSCVLETSILVIPENEAIPTIGLDGSGSGGNEFCGGLISAFVVDPIPGVQYEWSCGADFTDIVGVGTTLNYQEDSFTTKDLCVRIAGANAACDISACVEIIGGDGDIEVDFNGNPVIDCNGDVTPVLLSSNPDYMYTWDPLTGLTFTDMVNFSDPTVSVTEVTIYNVTITDGECSLDTSIMVIPEDLAIPEIELFGLGPNEDIFCNDSIFIDILNPIAGVQYEWSCGSEFTDIIGVGTSLVYEAEDDFGEKEICVRIAGADADCDISTCVTVFDGDPDVEYVNPLVMCPGDTIQYEITQNDSTEVLIYEFEDDPHIVGYDENGIPIIGVGENEEEFGIPFTITNEFCVLVDTLIVEPGVNLDLEFDWTLDECGTYIICFEALNIDLENGSPYWDFGDTSTEADTSLLFEPCYTYPDTGAYLVTLMDFADLCPGITVEMEINVPAELTIEINPDTISFVENPAIIMAETNGNPDSIVWCDSNGNPIGQGPDLTYDVVDMELISAKITDEFGCADTAYVYITIGGPFDNFPEIDGPGDEGVCENDTFNLSVMPDNPADFTYLWGPEDCIIGDNTGTEILATVGTETKDFAVTVTHIETMTDSIFSYTVIVNNVDITLDCDFEEGIINWGESGTISVANAPAGSTFEWSDGSTSESITVSPEEDMSYSVTVTDENGCTGEASKDVTVRPVDCTDKGVFLPTAFTPNNDGVNDVLILRSLWVERIDLFIVYDRWGEEVYNANGSTAGWDGTYENTELAPDVFAYCIKGVCVDGIEFTKVGNVSLLK